MTTAIILLSIGLAAAPNAAVAPVGELSAGGAFSPEVQVGPVEDLSAFLQAEPGGIEPSLLLRDVLQLDLKFVGVGTEPEGDTPTEVQFSADGSLIVISHRTSQNLVVFDAATRAVLQTIPLSGSPNSVALTSDGLYAVTANLFEDTASIVDMTAGVETAVVPVGQQPGIVRVTPDGTTAIVGNTIDSTLSVIDIATGTELRRIADAAFVQSISFGSWESLVKFTDFVITPDSATVVFPDWSNSRVQFFDIATGWVNSVPTGTEKPIHIDITPDGVTAVVTHDYPNSVLSVLNVPSQALIDSHSTGLNATSAPDVAINHSGTKAVMAVSNAVVVIDLTTGVVTGPLSTGSPGRLRTSFDGQYCVVGNYRGSIISFATSSIVDHTLNTTTPDWLAVSPADGRAATCHALRLEFMDVIQVDGSQSYQEDNVPTGPPPEGDKARNVAVTPDGTQAVVINNHSQNATLIDLTTQTVLGYADAGVRPGDVAVTPDGTKAVVANLDSSFATVVDLPALTTHNVNISRRAGQVVISPDSTYAYLAVVADGDGVWRINLDTLSVEGAKILTGNMGGIGFVFDQASGIALSPDGSLLVTCNSFSDTGSGQPDDLSLIDTAAWTELARITVGDFPSRATFAPSGNRIYVTNKNDGTVSVLEKFLGTWVVVSTINVGEQPYELTTNPSGDRLYVANYASKSISVVNTGTYAVVDTIHIPPTGDAGQPVGVHVSTDGTELYVAANGADFHVIDTATNEIVGTVNTGLAPAELGFSDPLGAALMPSPRGGDGLSIVFVRDGGDFDADGDLDLWDVARFQECFGQDGVDACLSGNLDTDLLTIDLDDYKEFAPLLTGPMAP
jgi:YVTN family beta-propeller protein